MQASHSSPQPLVHARPHTAPRCGPAPLQVAGGGFVPLSHAICCRPCLPNELPPDPSGQVRPGEQPLGVVSIGRHASTDELPVRCEGAGRSFATGALGALGGKEGRTGLECGGQAGGGWVVEHGAGPGKALLSQLLHKGCWRRVEPESWPAALTAFWPCVHALPNSSPCPAMAIGPFWPTLQSVATWPCSG